MTTHQLSTCFHLLVIIGLFPVLADVHRSLVQRNMPVESELNIRNRTQIKDSNNNAVMTNLVTSNAHNNGSFVSRGMFDLSAIGSKMSLPEYASDNVRLTTQTTDNIVSSSLRVDATFENISLNYAITGDDNLNSTLEVYYRETGTNIFKDAAIGMRAHPGLMIDGGSLGMNFHAVSVMFLKPDTEYDIEVILDDPDGGLESFIFSQRTKAIPTPSLSAVKYVAAGSGGGQGTQSNPYLGLQAAADAAVAGDHFIVTPGIYAPFTLLASGTADLPISFISETLHDAVINGQGTDRADITIGEFSANTAHVIIDGFVIENAKWGIDAQNTQFVTVRNNVIQDVDYGFINRRENGSESDQYITNNQIVGRTVWPQTGIPDERGIDIRGNNNVVSCNTIKNFGDGVSTDGPPYKVSYSLDIHNNEIQNAVDDLIEVDGTISNTRIYNNRCFNGRAGVSLAPIFGGPAYVIRNEFFNMENSAFKMNRGPSGMIVVHNTAVSESNVMESPNGWQNTYYRNNVMIASRYCFEMFGLVNGSQDDWDFGAYYSTRGGGTNTEWFKWNNVRYASVTELSASNIIEANSIEVALSDFEDIALPDPYPVEYAMSSQNFSPTSVSSAVINNGDLLDNLNVPYVTDNMPDRGALEFGQELPKYGAVFDDTTADAHIITSDDCIEILPNPFVNKIIIDGDFDHFIIEVYDINGQIVSDHTGTNAPLTIDLSALGSGMYFIKVSSTLYNKLNIYKIIKDN